MPNAQEPTSEFVGANAAKTQYGSIPSKHNMDSLIGLMKEFLDCQKYDRDRTNQRVYALEIKIAKFSRAFETMFKEELAQRVDGKQQYGSDCAQMEVDRSYVLEQKLKEIMK